MKLQRKFADEPSVAMQILSCPACMRPCGPSSGCEKMDHEPTFLKIGKMSVPVFTNTCYFKQKTPVLCDINYAFSEPLSQRIMGIKGVISVTAAHKYKFTIEIANAFNAKAVMGEVARTYRAFIKEMQAQELDLLNLETKVFDSVKLIMPNNQEVTMSPSSEEELRDLEQLKQDMPDIK